MEKRFDFGRSNPRQRPKAPRRPAGRACTSNAAALAGHIRSVVREDPKKSFRNRSFAAQAEQDKATKEFYDQKAAVLRLQEARERIKNEIQEVRARYPCATDCEILDRLIECQASQQAINVQRQRIERIQKGLQSPSPPSSAEMRPRSGPCRQPSPQPGPSRPPTGAIPRVARPCPSAPTTRSACAMKRPAQTGACPRKTQAVCKKPGSATRFEQGAAQQRMKELRERVRNEIDEVKNKYPNLTECEILNKLREMNAHPQTINYQQSKINKQAQCNNQDPNELQTCVRGQKKSMCPEAVPSPPSLSQRSVPRTTAAYVEELVVDPRFQQAAECPRASSPRQAESPCPRKAESPCPRQMEQPCPRQVEQPCPRPAEQPCPRQAEPPCPRQAEPTCPRRDQTCPQQEEICPRLAPRRMLQTPLKRQFRRSKDRSQAVCAAQCPPKSPGGRSRAVIWEGGRDASNAVYYPSTAGGGGGPCRLATVPEEPEWFDDHRRRLEHIRNKYLQKDEKAEFDDRRYSGISDISAITRVGVECAGDVGREGSPVPIAESTQRHMEEQQQSTSLLPHDRTITDLKYMIDEEKLEVRTMHSIISQHMEPASQVQYKDMSSFVPHVFSDDTETSPEVAAAILQSDERGLSLRSTPAKVYSSLFQGYENEKTIMKVNAPSANTKAGYIVPLSTQGAESTFVSYEPRGLYEHTSQDEDGEMPMPKKDENQNTTIKDNLGYSVTSMKPDSQASMSSDDGRFKITLQPETFQQPDYFQVRGSQAPHWFPGYYVTMGSSPRINVLGRPWTVLEKAWREFVPSKTKPEFGKVIVGT